MIVVFQCADNPKNSPMAPIIAKRKQGYLLFPKFCLRLLAGLHENDRPSTDGLCLREIKK
jgi:hypothetical protein